MYPKEKTTDINNTSLFLYTTYFIRFSPKYCLKRSTYVARLLPMSCKCATDFKVTRDTCLPPEWYFCVATIVFKVTIIHCKIVGIFTLWNYFMKKRPNWMCDQELKGLVVTCTGKLIKLQKCQPFRENLKRLFKGNLCVPEFHLVSF